MTIGELKELLDAYGDEMQVRVGATGEVNRVLEILMHDCGHVIRLEHFEPASSSDAPYVVLIVGPAKAEGGR